MNDSGECLACTEISRCGETNLEKVKRSFTCPLFKPVEEPEWLGRYAAITQFGEDTAITAMLEQNKKDKDNRE